MIMHRLILVQILEKLMSNSNKPKPHQSNNFSFVNNADEVSAKVRLAKRQMRLFITYYLLEGSYQSVERFGDKKREMHTPLTIRTLISANIGRTRHYHIYSRRGADQDNGPKSMSASVWTNAGIMSY